MRDELIKTLDLQQPNWHITLADTRDLQDFTRIVSEAANEESGLDALVQRQIKALKTRTAERLFVTLRAAVHSGLVIDLESLQGALGSAEIGRDLLDVARNAHTAEQELAALQRAADTPA
jgi:hypothetical protein